MGLSFRVSWNIHLIAVIGQMLANDNSGIIYYHYSVYMSDNKRVVSFQLIKHELPYEQIPKQRLFEISVNILQFRKPFKRI